MKKVIFFVLCGISLCALYGCNTIKGLGGAAAGLGKDVSTSWEKLRKADDWLQQKAW